MLLIFGLWTPRFYVTRGLPLVVVGGAILLVRLLDICLDPVIAIAMDPHRDAIGRYRPWMILGVPSWSTASVRCCCLARTRPPAT